VGPISRATFGSIGKASGADRIVLLLSAFVNTNEGEQAPESAVESSDLTAKQMFEALKTRSRISFGFGIRPALINVDLQRAFTDTATFPRAYENDPRQMEYTNRLAAAARAGGIPVVWTYCAYALNGNDAGIWGTRGNGPDAVQNIKEGSLRAALDPRLMIDRTYDVVLRKRMPSAFFETNVASLLRFHRVDTLIVTGGSTSGCVRATAVDALSYGFRVTVVEECVADRHEGPHYANLYDIVAKYGDVRSFTEVEQRLLSAGAQAADIKQPEHAPSD
jgi:maleamate amidohydrolase